jgi:adenine-specific DNA-methyltransferase
MAAIDDLIIQIEDKALRKRLELEVRRATKEKKFGLVFENHLPEMSPLYAAKARKHSKVALRSGPLTDLWRVLTIKNGEASCRNIRSGENRWISLDELVVVSQFGEPVFPALTPVDRVQNGPKDCPWHTLIEGENYFALQLLEYLYAGKVDCIYIDPPYNSGARDWKYNNDFVDSNDRWRHSKWLAFIRRRISLAKHLLSKNGVLIVTIDDNESSNLRCLLAELFPSYNIFTIVIEHNKRGRQGEEFAKTHEYAFFVVPEVEDVISEEPAEGAVGGEVRNLRRTGNNSLRSARPNQFYPIWVDQTSLQIKDVGDSLPAQETPKKQPSDNLFPVWPIDKNGIERNWHYGSARTLSEINDGKIFAKKQKYGIQIYYKLREKETKRYKTVWSKPALDASTHGTELLRQIFGGISVFQFPKSVYAVKECISTVCQNRPNALVIDFFAGSGTTLNAVNLLNSDDMGNRRCIMVTNNEVSEDDAVLLAKKGCWPGNPSYEKNGICQSVTWPRSKYTIIGKRDDGSDLEGEYLTGKTLEKEKSRRFHQIGFTSIEDLNTLAKKKQLVALIDGIPQSEVKKDSAFVVSEKHPASILFDDSEAEAWLKALEDQEHISDFYVVTAKRALFDKLKNQIQELLGPIVATEEEKRPMREGFPANLEYFRLEFLDKDHVALGRQFREILPLLWLRAGAIGPRPELPKNKPISPMLIPKKNPFAVLVDETQFADFSDKIESRDDLSHVFLVTDSEEAFQEMAAQINVPNVVQLYRDYLENFVINKAMH